MKKKQASAAEAVPVGSLLPIRAAQAAARAQLLGARCADGHWEGRLSSSALSTATAVMALELAGNEELDRRMIADGQRWLIANQNADGGWGDTILSDSNISTTLICWSALRMMARRDSVAAAACQLAEKWVARVCGDTHPATLARKVAERYGRDRTFSVPILMVCALSGLLGEEDRKAWRRVLSLPFELATVPRWCFAFLRLPVVSYALPALIAIGYARFVHAPPPAPLSWVRRWAWPRVSKLLREIQPQGGGFLEATPLTSFVTIALAAAGEKTHPVADAGIGFLRRSVRADGSWPIDTNLATWATTLAIKAVAVAEKDGGFPAADGRDRLRSWLVRQQFQEVHPFTHAPPGGWAWTDLPGGVPDADDTAGALLALLALAEEDSSAPDRDLLDAASAGCQWLLGLQNRDGGMPTFCRGWGALPFDRSAPDLTAHALRAWHAWLPFLSPDLQKVIARATVQGLKFLKHAQRADGSWAPLWFGNQHLTEEENTVYGTAKVLLALAVLDSGVVLPERMVERAVAWLVSAQHQDGSWGGVAASDASIEETALALDALSAIGVEKIADVPWEALLRSAHCLVEKTSVGTRFPSAPIGFYFAKLWYFEEIYPVVWTVSALGRFLKAYPARAETDTAKLDTA